jgi:hypothetical protein
VLCYVHNCVLSSISETQSCALVEECGAVTLHRYILSQYSRDAIRQHNNGQFRAILFPGVVRNLK